MDINSYQARRGGGQYTDVVQHHQPTSNNNNGVVPGDHQQRKVMYSTTTTTTSSSNNNTNMNTISATSRARSGSGLLYRPSMVQGAVADDAGEGGMAASSTAHSIRSPVPEKHYYMHVAATGDEDKMRNQEGTNILGGSSVGGGLPSPSSPPVATRSSRGGLVFTPIQHQRRATTTSNADISNSWLDGDVGALGQRQQHYPTSTTNTLHHQQKNGINTNSVGKGGGGHGTSFSSMLHTASAASSSSPLRGGGGSHDGELSTILQYLKGYYGQEEDEDFRGLDTMTADDVLALAQCFYLDIFRLLRDRRLEGGRRGQNSNTVTDTVVGGGQQHPHLPATTTMSSSSGAYDVADPYNSFLWGPTPQHVGVPIHEELDATDRQQPDHHHHHASPPPSPSSVQHQSHPRQQAGSPQPPPSSSSPPAAVGTAQQGPPLQVNQSVSSSRGPPTPPRNRLNSIVVPPSSGGSTPRHHHGPSTPSASSRLQTPRSRPQQQQLPLVGGSSDINRQPLPPPIIPTVARPPPATSPTPFPTATALMQPDHSQHNPPHSNGNGAPTSTSSAQQPPPFRHHQRTVVTDKRRDSTAMSDYDAQPLPPPPQPQPQQQQQQQQRSLSPSHYALQMGSMPPPRPIPNVSLRSVMPLLQKGGYLVKYAQHGGKPQRRYMFLKDLPMRLGGGGGGKSSGTKGGTVMVPHLCWSSRPAESAKETLPLLYLLDVKIGSNDNFKRDTKSGRIASASSGSVREEHCFTLLFNSRSVDLAAEQESDFQMWAGGMFAILRRNEELSSS